MRISTKFSLVLALAVSLPAWAQSGANNGLGAGSGFGIFGPVDPAVNSGTWLEFSFTTAGTPAKGCSPADPAGLSCVPSSGGNSVFADAPPWTFGAPWGGATLKVTDAFLRGDVFEVFDSAASIGTTTAVPATGTDCGSDPAVCILDPTVSSRTYNLAAGNHSLTITPTVSPYGGGAAYFKVDTVAKEVPIDIKFCSNPNAFNCKNNGGTPLTIFGTAAVPVSQIDIPTLRLCRNIIGTACVASGPRSWSIADRGNPATDLGASMCAVVDGVEQHYLHPDGLDDLDVSFDSQELGSLIGCGVLDKGDVTTTLYLIGYLKDGTTQIISQIPAPATVGIDKLLIVTK